MMVATKALFALFLCISVIKDTLACAESDGCKLRPKRESNAVPFSFTRTYPGPAAPKFILPFLSQQQGSPQTEAYYRTAQPRGYSSSPYFYRSSPSYYQPYYRSAPSYYQPYYRSAPSYYQPYYRSAPSYYQPYYRSSPSYYQPYYRSSPSYYRPYYRSSPSYYQPYYRSFPSYYQPYYRSSPSYYQPYYRSSPSYYQPYYRSSPSYYQPYYRTSPSFYQPYYYRSSPQQYGPYNYRTFLPPQASPVQQQYGSPALYGLQPRSFNAPAPIRTPSIQIRQLSPTDISTLTQLPLAGLNSMFGGGAATASIPRSIQPAPAARAQQPRSSNQLSAFPYYKDSVQSKN